MTQLKHQTFLFRLLLVLALLAGTGLSAGGAFAASGLAQTTTLAPCAGENLSGQVVAVDEATNTVIVQLADGTRCTVTVTGTYDHPIAALLGMYFGDVSASSFAEALTQTEGCAHPTVNADGSVTYSWAGAGTCVTGDQSVRVTQVTQVTNPDGTVTYVATAEYTAPDGTVTVIQVTLGDQATADALSGALQDLMVAWTLDGNGGMVEPIEAYHDEGMGFGVLVKLYAIAAESQEGCATISTTQPMTAEDGTPLTCGVSVQQLVDEFNSGVGMGQLFKEYGKPGLLGVGHVRKALKNQASGETSQEETSPTGGTSLQSPTQPGNGNGNAYGLSKDKSQKSNAGVCKAQSNGKGKGKVKNGGTVSCP